MHRRTSLIATLVAATLALAGCGSTAKPADPKTPQRIVSLSPTATEMLYAIGAGKQVTAVDDQSDHPAGVPKTDLSGYKPNAEAIASVDTYLVLLDRRCNRGACRMRWLEAQRSVRPVTIVMW